MDVRSIFGFSFSPLVRAYRRKRRISSKLANLIVQTLEKREITEAARRLGMLYQQSIAVEYDSDLAVMFDFAIHCLRKDGKNVIERFAADPPTKLKPEERDALERMAAARYRILLVEDVEPGVGLIVRDELRGDSGFLADRALSATADPSVRLASLVIEWDKFRSTTGAALPLDDRMWKDVKKQLFKRFDKLGSDPLQLTIEDDAQVAEFCIRKCLKAGATGAIGYL